METKPALYKYFSDTADVLLTQYQRSRAQKSSENTGANREFFCSNFLQNVLPSRLTLRRGEIWDKTLNKSGQLEIILTRDDCPSLTFGGEDSFLVEGVFSVIEVKSNLTRTKLKQAIQTLRNVHDLTVTQSMGSWIQRDNSSSLEFLDRPLRIVFAYHGATFRTILDELLKPENLEIVDLVCILERGSVIKKELIDWSCTDPYFCVNGKVASLGWLYYALVKYSTNLLGRIPNYLGYFEPVENW